MGALLDEYRQELSVRQTQPGFNKDAFKTEFLAARGKAPKQTPGRGIPSRGVIADVATSIPRGIVGSAEMYLRDLRQLDPEGGSTLIRDMATKGLSALEAFKAKHPSLQPSREAESGLRRALTEGVESFVESASAFIPGLIAGAAVPIAAPFIGAAGGAAIFGLAEKDRFEEEVEKFIVREKLTDVEAADLREKGKTQAIKSALVEGGFELAANTLQVITLGLFKPLKGVAKEGIKSTFGSLFKQPAKSMLRRGTVAYLKTAATEVGTETAQEALETKFRRDIGITDMRSLDAALSVIAPTLVTSLLFLGSAKGINTLDKRSIKKGLEEAVNPDGTPASAKKRKKAVDAAVAVIYTKKNKDAALRLRRSAYAYIDSGLSIDLDTELGVIEVGGYYAKGLNTGEIDVQEVEKLADGVLDERPQLSGELKKIAASYRIANNVADMGETAEAGAEEDLAETMIKGGDADPAAAQADTDGVKDVGKEDEVEEEINKELAKPQQSEFEADRAEPTEEEIAAMSEEELEALAEREGQEAVEAERKAELEGVKAPKVAELEPRVTEFEEPKTTQERKKAQREGIEEPTKKVSPQEKREILKNLQKIQDELEAVEEGETVDVEEVIPEELVDTIRKQIGEDATKEEFQDLLDSMDVEVDERVASKLFANVQKGKGVGTGKPFRPTLAEPSEAKLIPQVQEEKGEGTGEAFRPTLAEKEELKEQPVKEEPRIGIDVTEFETEEEITGRLIELRSDRIKINKDFAKLRKDERESAEADTRARNKVINDEIDILLGKRDKLKKEPTPEVKEKPPVPTPTEQTAFQKETDITSDEELDAMLDAAKPETKKKKPRSATEKKEGRKPRASTKELKEKTAGDVLADAARSGVKGAESAVKGMFELFGGASIKSFPLVIDKEKYAKAKPHFTKAANEFANAGKSLKDFIQFAVNNFGDGIKPYLKRFIQESRTPIEVTPEVKPEEQKKPVDVGEKKEKPVKEKKEKKKKVDAEPKRIRLKDVGEVVPGKRSQKNNFERIKEAIKAAETGNTNKDLNKLLNRAVRTKLWDIKKEDRPNATPGVLRWLEFVRDSAMGVNLYVTTKIGVAVATGTAKNKLETYARIEDLPGDRKGYNEIAEWVAKYENAIQVLGAATETANTIQEASSNIIEMLKNEEFKEGDNVMFHLNPQGEEITDIYSWKDAMKAFVQSAGRFAEEEHLEKAKPKDLRRQRQPISDMERENVPDHRKENPNPSSQDFIDRFGFRATEFGEYVGSDAGRRHVNLAWDSFHDLTDLLKMPIKAASVTTEQAGTLHGTGESKDSGQTRAGIPLAMAFGSRGRGRHAAHYEPSNHLINMTRDSGDGSLSHEWMHALDSTLSITPTGRRAIADITNTLAIKYDIARAQAEVEEILTGNSRWTRGRIGRTPIEVATEFLENKWKNTIVLPTNYSKKSEVLGEYWNRPEEKLARGFEAYIYDSLPGSSPYLVSSWVDGSTTSESEGYRSNPYPEGEEREQFNRIFKHFTDGIQWTEDGVPSMKEGYEFVSEKEEKLAQEALDKIKAKLKEMFDAMHQGKPSKDGLWWYEYKATKRGNLMQPKGINAHDDSFGENGAIGYTEALLPDDILHYKLKSVTHDKDENKVYLKEKDDGGKPEPGDILDTAGLDGEATLGEVEAADGEGAETGTGVPRRPIKRPGEKSNEPREPGTSADASPHGDGESATDVDTAAGGTPSPDVKSGQDAVLAGGNYRITPDDRVGQGTLNEKFSNNISAIRTLKLVEKEGRKATREEQAVLVKYVGWGGMSQAFSEFAKEGWLDKFEILKSTLTDEEYETARASVLSAFYTSPEIVTKVYDAIQRFGFKGGRVLEPAVGTGNFFGMLPEALEHSQLSGVEMDNVSARIAKQLYQRASIYQSPYEKSVLPRNFYDVAISNVPFESVIPFDREYNKKRYQLHDYYFNKTLELVRPGGIVAFITSAGTMDKVSEEARKEFSKKADFVGAIRLPDTAFKDAGTKVTADIVFLRRKGGTGAEIKAHKWLEVTSYSQQERTEGVKANDTEVDSLFTSGGTTPISPSVNINEYFAANPEMMLGKMEKAGRWDNSQNLIADGRDIEEALASAVNKLPENIYVEAENIVEVDIADLIPDEGVYTDGDFFEQDGKLFMFRGTLAAEELEENTPHQKKKGKVIRSYIKIRSARRAMLKAQAKEESKPVQRKLTAKLNKVYDEFVKKHGFLNLPDNVRAFVTDPEAPRILGLENWNDETGDATKSDIFSKRWIENLKPISKVSKPVDALPHSLNTQGRVDIPYIAKLSGVSEDEAIKELGGSIWNDPEAGWVTADEYLSGNIKAKIALAEQASKSDPTYKKNIEALTPLIPEDLPPSQIRANLGAPWLEPTDIQEFIRHLVPQGFNVHVDYVPEIGLWRLSSRGGGSDAGAKRLMDSAKNSVAATATWGTSKKDFFELLEKYILNGSAKGVRVMTTVGTGKEAVEIINIKETEAAQAKLEAIKEKFATWLWEDDARLEKYIRKYNDVYNGNVARQFDGSHLTFPGQVPDDIIKLTPHQKNAVWRAITTGFNAYFAHEVGTGKTYAMVATIMEAKRLGLKKKPMLLAANSNIESIAEDFVKLYPTARILRLDIKKDPFERKIQLNRIANNEWDAVIIGHDSFKNITLSSEGMQAALGEEIDNLRLSLQLAQEAGAAKFTVKAIEERIKALEEKVKVEIEKLNEQKIDLDFEELGVDMLVVDEAHIFKNIPYGTKLDGIVGISGTGSGKAFDLHLKTRWINEKYGGGIILASGTPVTNSVAEIYNIGRYLNPQTLRDKGIHTFDAWAAAFGNITQTAEFKPEGGGYRMVRKFKEFFNIPELRAIVKEVVDVIMAKDLNLKVPKILTGNPIPIVVPQNKMVSALGQEMLMRAKSIRGGGIKKQPRHPDKTDIMFSIISDGRNGAIDMRLVDEFLPDDPDTKVNYAVRNIFQSWKASKDMKGTQLVFADRGVPKGKPSLDAQGRVIPKFNKAGKPLFVKKKVKDEFGKTVKDPKTGKAETEMVQALVMEPAFDIYNDMKNKLVKMGIPEHEIVFPRNYKNKLKRKKLFNQINAGDVRVIIGSTADVGIGVNVQDRGVALHNLDTEWTFERLEQRRGRFVRQGNIMYDKGLPVAVFNYMTEGTVDAFMWDKVANKKITTEVVLQGDDDQRVVADVSQESASHQEMMAFASGDPRFKHKVDLEAEVRKLNAVRGNWVDERARLMREAQGIPRTIESMHAGIDFRNNATAYFSGINAVKIGEVIYDLKRHAKEINERMAVILNPKAVKKVYKAGTPVPLATYGAAKTEEIETTEEVEVTKTVDGKKVKVKEQRKKVNKVMSWIGNEVPVYVRPPFFLSGAALERSDIETLKIGTKTKYGEWEMAATGGLARLLSNTKSAIERESKESQDLIDKRTKDLVDIKKSIAKPFEQEAEHTEKTAELNALVKELSVALQQQEDEQGKIDPDLERFKSQAKDVGEMDTPEEGISLSTGTKATIISKEKEYWSVTNRIGYAVVAGDQALKDKLEKERTAIQEELAKLHDTPAKLSTGRKTTAVGALADIYTDLFNEAESILGRGKVDMEVITQEDIKKRPDLAKAAGVRGITEKELIEEHDIKGAYQSVVVDGVAVRGVISIASDGVRSVIDMQGTVRHEMFHGVFERLLNNKDRKIIMDKFGTEEKAADAFADYVADTGKLLPTSVKGIFGRLQEFFQRMNNLLRGRGFKTAGDIFGAAASGELANKASTMDAVGTDISLSVEKGVQEEDLTGENDKARARLNDLIKGVTPVQQQTEQGLKNVVTQNPANVTLNKTHTRLVDEIYAGVSNTDIKWHERMFGLPWFLAKKFKEWATAVGIELKREEDKNLIITEFQKKVGKLEKGEIDHHEIMTLKANEEEGVLLAIYEGDARGEVFSDDALRKGISITTLGELDKKFQGKVAKLSPKQIAAYKAWQTSTESMKERVLQAIDNLTYMQYSHEPWVEKLKATVKRHEMQRARQRKVETDTGKITDFSALSEEEIPPRMKPEDRQKFVNAFNKVLPKQAKLAVLRRAMGDVVGYAPRSRQGKYVVTTYDMNGNTLWSERSEKEKDNKGFIDSQIKRMRELGFELGKDFTVAKEVKDKASEFIFDQIQASSVERFINKALNQAKTNEKISEADIDAVQEEMITLLSDEFKGRGFAAHMMKRREGFPIGGYDISNIKRRYAEYVSGAAGYITKQVAAYEYANMLSSIDINTKPDLYEDLAKYSGDMLRNSTRLDRISGRVRTAAFVWYLAGQLKSPIVNFTQNWILGIPLLEKEMGAGAKGIYHKAMYDVARKKYTDKEKRFITEMAARGITGDQLTKEITGQTTAEAGKLYESVITVLATPFSLSEIYNRKVSGLARFRAAIAAGDDYQAAFDKSRKFIFDVHFLYGKLNAPSGARGGTPGAAILRTSLTFRNYTFNFLHAMKGMLSERDFKTVAKAMTYMALLGGASALPFLDGFLDMLERITGVPWRKNIKKELESVGGEVLANIGIQGLPTLIGADIGGSLRIHFPDITQPGKLIEESVFGVYEGLALKAVNSIKAASTGQIARAFEIASPTFIERPLKALRQSKEGLTTTRGKVIKDPRGKAIMPTTGENIATGLGFRPSRLARMSDHYRQFGNIKKYYSDWRGDIFTKFRLAKTFEGRQKVIQEVMEYNRKAADQKGAVILIHTKQLKQALKQRRDKRFAAFSQ